MTIEEMRKAIVDKCFEVNTCDECEFEENEYCAKCAKPSYIPNAEIPNCYELFFGKSADVVNHPSHYETGKFECIDVMIETQGEEAVKNFCLCNAFKYLYRHNRKNGIEDVKKAKWYIEKYVELEEKVDVK